jgi:hypothetical protein
MKQERRSPLFLLTGLMLGLIAGLVISLLVVPGYYVDISPRSLANEEKDAYRALIAMAYTADGDLGRAQARLALLEDENVVTLLTTQAQRLLSLGSSPNEARALALLAEALQQQPGPTLALPGSTVDITSPTSPLDLAPSATVDAQNAIRTPTSAPLASITPMASATPLITAIPEEVLNAPFILHDQAQNCDPAAEAPRLQVEILDQTGQPIPGVRIEVTWEGGQSIFFTGLHPHVDPGYADFTMQPEVVYTLRAGSSGEIIRDLASQQCDAQDGAYPGGWRLVFVAP